MDPRSQEGELMKFLPIRLWRVKLTGGRLLVSMVERPKGVRFWKKVL